MNLIEFHDYPWFPDVWRRGLTLYIVAFHKLIGTVKVLGPLISDAMRRSKALSVIDICSGGGGPMADLAKSLSTADGQPVQITLTDLYPNKVAIETIKSLKLPSLTYLEKSVNAADVPDDLKGLRTMVASFHHMSPEVARGILKDAFNKRQPIWIGAFKRAKRL
jgi:hypothetical protein